MKTRSWLRWKMSNSQPRWCTWLRSSEIHDLPGDGAALRTEKEINHVKDVLGCPFTLDGQPLNQLTNAILGDIANEIGVHRGRSDGVDSDAKAAKLTSQHTCERLDGALAGRVERLALDAHGNGDRGEVDNAPPLPFLH